MDIRHLATSINIEISGIEITMLLSKDEILEKYLEVTEGDTITKAKAELLKFLNNFAKSLYIKERIDEELLEQVAHEHGFRASHGCGAGVEVGVVAVVSAEAAGSSPVRRIGSMAPFSTRKRR